MNSDLVCCGVRVQSMLNPPLTLVSVPVKWAAPLCVSAGYTAFKGVDLRAFHGQRRPPLQLKVSTVYWSLLCCLRQAALLLPSWRIHPAVIGLVSWSLAVKSRTDRVKLLGMDMVADSGVVIDTTMRGRKTRRLLLLPGNIIWSNLATGVMRPQP
ncbi:thrombospondin-3 [Lates japonicus]|uniref:Thrombospondin-3 n=1 Tax=Lates japonicus TaxID=270547 RepID=A0AAD3NAG4_LATJO|nr:thrombospondin-3 [Lates japonicus]